MKRNNIDMPLFGLFWITALHFVLATCSAYFTYRGAVMAIDAGLVTWAGRPGALIFSIGSATAIFILWTVAPHAFAKLETVPEQLVGLCITLVACVMIFSLSSWLNVAGIAGQSALRFHMNRIIVEYEDVLDRRSAAAIAFKSFQPDLQQANVLFLERRNEELKHGAYTNHAGPGTVERLLLVIANRFAAQDGAIANEAAKKMAVTHKARLALDAMRVMANQPGDPKARMEALAREADGLRTLLSELDPKGYLEGLQRTLKAMPRELTLQTISAKTKKGVKAQKAALQRIEGELTQTVDQLTADLGKLSGRPLPPVPTVTRLNAIEAVLRYPLQNAPYWAGGIAMDFTPTVILLFAMLMKAARGRQGLFVDATDDVTVKQIKIVQHALESIREGRISRQAIDRLHDELTGGLLLKDESRDKSSDKDDQDV